LVASGEAILITFQLRSLGLRAPDSNLERCRSIAGGRLLSWPIAGRGRGAWARVEAKNAIASRHCTTTYLAAMLSHGLVRKEHLDTLLVVAMAGLDLSMCVDRPGRSTPRRPTLVFRQTELVSILPPRPSICYYLVVKRSISTRLLASGQDW